MNFKFLIKVLAGFKGSFYILLLPLCISHQCFGSTSINVINLSNLRDGKYFIKLVI